MSWEILDVLFPLVLGDAVFEGRKGQQGTLDSHGELSNPFEDQQVSNRVSLVIVEVLTLHEATEDSPQF